MEDIYNLPNPQHVRGDQFGQLVSQNNSFDESTSESYSYLGPSQSIYSNASYGIGMSSNFTNDKFHWLPKTYEPSNNLSYEELRELCETYDRYFFFRLVVDVFVVGTHVPAWPGRQFTGH